MPPLLTEAVARQAANCCPHLEQLVSPCVSTLVTCNNVWEDGLGQAPLTDPSLEMIHSSLKGFSSTPSIPVNEAVTPEAARTSLSNVSSSVWTEGMKCLCLNLTVMPKAFGS